MIDKKAHPLSRRRNGRKFKKDLVDTQLSQYSQYAQSSQGLSLRHIPKQDFHCHFRSSEEQHGHEEMVPSLWASAGLSGNWGQQWHLLGYGEAK